LAEPVFAAVLDNIGFERFLTLIFIREKFLLTQRIRLHIGLSAYSHGHTWAAGAVPASPIST
jgi:hypothetical protein